MESAFEEIIIAAKIQMRSDDPMALCGTPEMYGTQNTYGIRWKSQNFFGPLGSVAFHKNGTVTRKKAGSIYKFPQ